MGMTSADAAKLGSFATTRFQIGKRDFGRTRITLKEFVAPNVDGVLGTDFLESKVLCIDPKNHLAAIK
jgi:hypothetical protein